MTNHNLENRVFSRTNARPLTAEEMKEVAGGLRTGNCTFDPKTCVMDRDCEPPIGC